MLDQFVSKADAGASNAARTRPIKDLIIKRRALKEGPMEATATASASKRKEPPSLELAIKLAKSRADQVLKVKDNSGDKIKPVPLWVQRAEIPVGIVKETNKIIYDSVDPVFQNFVVPDYIEESCTLALEKYNNDKGTNYRYVRLLYAHEGGKTHDRIDTLIFRASQSDSDSDSYSKTFTTKITSGFRFSKGGEMSFGEEVQHVSRGAW